MADKNLVNQPAPRQHIPALQPMPPRGELPEIAWIEVTKLNVDYSYQHPPYSRAIESLQKDFNPKLSGFILVNRRDDGSLYIIDGQTRRAVHEILHLRWIRAEIMQGLSDAQEAEAYLVKCINAQRLPVDSFLAEFKARKPVAVLIHDILQKREIVVESYATGHGGSTGKSVVSCVASLKRLLRRDPDGEHLGATLDLIIDTWGHAKGVLGGQFIEIMHGLLLRYGDEIERKAFMTKLGAYPLNELYELARNVRYASTPQITLRSAMQRKIIELYNMGRSGTKRISL